MSGFNLGDWTFVDTGNGNLLIINEKEDTTYKLTENGFAKQT